MSEGVPGGFFPRRSPRLGEDPPVQRPGDRPPRASGGRLPGLRPGGSGQTAGVEEGAAASALQSPWRGERRLPHPAQRAKPGILPQTRRRRRFPRLTPRRLAHNQRPRSGLRPDASLEGWQSGQMQRTVNPSGQPYAGSNPAPSTNHSLSRRAFSSAAYARSVLLLSRPSDRRISSMFPAVFIPDLHFLRVQYSPLKTPGSSCSNSRSAAPRWMDSSVGFGTGTTCR